MVYFVQFMTFPSLDSGLAHYSSEPFSYFLIALTVVELKAIVMCIAKSVSMEIVNMYMSMQGMSMYMSMQGFIQNPEKGPLTSSPLPTPHHQHTHHTQQIHSTFN